MEQKIKHLEFIQQIIGRMGNNSFLLKGWSITLVLAVLALSEKAICNSYLYLAVFVFFLLDTYFLFQEKNFIDLYNGVRKDKIKNFEIKLMYSWKNVLKAFFSIPNILFYLLLARIIFLTF